MAHAGDIDGDGLDDIMIGALRYTGKYKWQGAVYIVLGSSLLDKKTLFLSQADLKLVGPQREQYVGHAVFSAGDVDGDKLADIVIGSWAGPDWRGITYVITGKSIEDLPCN